MQCDGKIGTGTLAQMRMGDDSPVDLEQPGLAGDAIDDELRVEKSRNPQSPAQRFRQNACARRVAESQHRGLALARFCGDKPFPGESGNRGAVERYERLSPV